MQARFLYFLRLLKRPTSIESSSSLQMECSTKPYRSIVGYGMENPSLTERLVGLPWIADGMTGKEERAGGNILDLARQDSALAKRLVELPWIADSIMENELEMIGDIKRIAEINPEMANSATNIPGEIGDLAKMVVRSLQRIHGNDPDLLEQLVSQLWFQDGLNDEEAALIVTLTSMVYQEGYIPRPHRRRPRYF